MRRWIPLVGVALLIPLLIVILWVRHAAWPLFSGPALTELVIPGPLTHVQPQAVRAAVLPVLGKGFFSTNMSLVQAAVQAVPWVASAAVRRGWPHTLYIDITEEVPIARWNDTGLMDAQGHVFVHSSDAVWQKLPALAGPDGGQQDVLTEYTAFTSFLATHGLAIRQLTVDARGDSTLELDDGIKVRLGRADVEPRLERFVTVALPTLGEKLASVAYVDMRYPNGFAVGWTSPGTSPACQRRTSSNESLSSVEMAGGHARDGAQSVCTTPAGGHSKEVGPNV
jgi:cell division protein FtsQ